MINYFILQLPVVQAAEHQGEHTTKHIYFHVLSVPTVLGAQGDVMDVLNTTRGDFHARFYALTADDLHVRL